MIPRSFMLRILMWLLPSYTLVSGYGAALRRRRVSQYDILSSEQFGPQLVEDLGRRPVKGHRTRVITTEP